MMEFSLLLAHPLFAIFLGFFLIAVGASVGSFLAVVVYRLPKGLSIVVLWSHCENCEVPLRGFQKIPILSWFFLKGKCAHCHHRIGLRPLYFEILFGTIVPVLYLRYGFTILALESLAFFSLLVVIAFIDMDTLFIPVSLLLWLWGLGLIFCFFNWLVPNTQALNFSSSWVLQLWPFLSLLSFRNPLFDGLFGGFIGVFVMTSILLFSTWLFRRSGRLSEKEWAMGFGDVWFLGGIGMYLGATRVFLVLFLASILGSIVGLLAEIAKKGSRQKSTPMPFGPFLSLAGLVGFFFT